MNAIRELLKSRCDITDYSDTRLERGLLNVIVSNGALVLPKGKEHLYKACVVDEPALLDGIALACDNQKWISGAGAVIIMAYMKDQNATGNEQQVTSIESLSFMIDQALMLGLGYSFINNLNGKMVGEMLFVPPEYEIPQAITVGYPRTMDPILNEKKLQNFLSYNGH